MLVLRHAGAICSCLAHLVVALPSDCNVISDCGGLFLAGEDVLRKDQEYCRRVSQAFYGETLSMARCWPRSERLIQQHLPTVARCFVQSLVDSSVFERYPVADLDELRALSGDTACIVETKWRSRIQRQKQRQVPSLPVFRLEKNGEEFDSIGPVTCASICQKDRWNLFLRLIFQRNDCPTEGDISSLGLIDPQNPVVGSTSNAIPSLEAEVTTRTRMSLFLIDAVKQLPEMSRLIQETFRAAVSEGLMSILDGMEYENTHRSRNIGLRSRTICTMHPGQDQLLSHSHAKLVILQRSYIHMFVAVGCQLIVSYPGNATRHLTNTFVQILQQRDPRCVRRLMQTWQEKDSEQRQQLPNRTMPSLSSQRTDFSTSCLGRLQRLLRVSLWRRSGDLVPSFAIQENYGGLIALVASIESETFSNEHELRDACLRVAKGFFLRPTLGDTNTSDGMVDGDHHCDAILLCKVGGRSENDRFDPSNDESLIENARRRVLHNAICRSLTTGDNKPHTPLLLLGFLLAGASHLPTNNNSNNNSNRTVGTAGRQDRLWLSRDSLTVVMKSVVAYIRRAFTDHNTKTMISDHDEQRTVSRSNGLVAAIECAKVIAAYPSGSDWKCIEAASPGESQDPVLPYRSAFLRLVARFCEAIRDKEPKGFSYFQKGFVTIRETDSVPNFGNNDDGVSADHLLRSAVLRYDAEEQRIFETQRAIGREGTKEGRTGVLAMTRTIPNSNGIMSASAVNFYCKPSASSSNRKLSTRVDGTAVSSDRSKAKVNNTVNKDTNNSMWFRTRPMLRVTAEYLTVVYTV